MCSYILQIKEIFIFENVYFFTVFYFFSFIIKKILFMDELSVLSISLSIASLGIFFLFFASNDDDDQDGGQLIKSLEKIN